MLEHLIFRLIYFKTRNMAWYTQALAQAHQAYRWNVRGKFITESGFKGLHTSESNYFSGTLWVGVCEMWSSGIVRGGAHTAKLHNRGQGYQAGGLNMVERQICESDLWGRWAIHGNAWHCKDLDWRQVMYFQALPAPSMFCSESHSCAEGLIVFEIERICLCCALCASHTPNVHVTL